MSTVHTSDQHTPSQLFSYRNANLNIKQVLICTFKSLSTKVNKNVFPFVHHKDRVQITNSWKSKFNHDTYIIPYITTKATNNLVIQAHKRNITDKQTETASLFIEYG